MTVIGISLLVGAVAGLLVGVSLGRFIERIAPSKSDEDEAPNPKKKKIRR